MKRSILVLCLSVALFTALALRSISSTPVLVDEFAHLPAGVSYWELGRFGLYRENPPFIRLLVSLPAWLAGARVDYGRAAVGYRSEWRVGADFAHANEAHFALYLWMARAVVVALSVCCGCLIFWWAALLFGWEAGAVAAIFWFSDPNVLAHSSLASTDVGAALTSLAAAFAYWLFLQRPGVARTLIAGAALGLAEASKFSALVLYPAFAAASLARRRGAGSRTAASDSQRLASCYEVTSVFLISIFVLNLTYSFDGTLTALGSYNFRSPEVNGLAARQSELPPSGNCFRSTPLAGLPLG